MTESRNSHTITVVAALGAFVFCYAQVIASLVREWSTNDLYSYGFAVPFIAVYIWWVRAKTSPRLEAAPDYAFGVPVLLTGMAMLVVGRYGAVVAVEQVSLVVTLAGLILLLFGRRAVGSHWFAIVYLVSMVPVWNELLTRLQDPSRLLSTKLAVFFLHSAGIPALRQGTIIVLPSHALSVLRECSGVNQLVALTAMVLPAAYLWLDTNARRVALLCLAVVVSYLGNGFRIALVGWLAVKGHGDGNLNASAHLLQGLGVSTLGYLVIGGCFSILSKSNGTVPDRRDDRGQMLTPTLPPTASPSLARPRRLWLDVALLCVMLGSASRLSAVQLPVGLSHDFRSLESRIDDWTLEIGPRAPVVPFPAIDDNLLDVGGYPTLAGERRFAGVDDELVRAYRNAAGAQVDLYVGYYHRQEQGKELAGEASHALGAAASELTLETASGTLDVNEVIRDTGDTRRGLLFWYDVNGRIVPDIYRAKRYTIWDALTRRRTNGAVVMIAWEGRAGGQAAAAREHAIGFAQALMPVLRQHLPS